MTALAPVLALLLLPPPGRSERPLEVPRGPAPVVDGRVSEEWSRAAVVDLGGGARLRLLHDGLHLFLALELPAEGIGSVCVGRGPEARVLHASMALGTAVFRRSDSGWRLEEPFAFGMRDTDFSDEARRKREAFLAANGWLASTAPMARPGSALEFQISLDALDREDLRIGLASLPMSGEGEVIRWPATLGDGCAGVALVQGSAPESAELRPEEWGRLVLAR